MKKYIFLTLILLTLQTTCLFSLAEHYQIIDLGLQKYSSSKVTSLNNQGWICGLLADDDKLTVFVLDNQQKMALRQQPRTSNSLIINNANEVFGSAIYRVSDSYWIYDQEQIFKWINPFNYFQYFNFYYLGCPKGQYSTAHDFKTNIMWDVNDLGQALVMNCQTFSEAMNEFNKTATWIYDNGSFVKIVDNHFQAGFKINNHSQILGSYYKGSSLNGDRQEFVSIYDYLNKTTRLFDFPSDSLGIDFNDCGQVVGSFYSPEDLMWKGFLAESTGEIVDMQTFYPFLINNKGIIVGIYDYSNSQSSITLWEKGYFYDLMNLVNLVDDKGNRWESILEIVDINDDGYMIGQGKINGVVHGLLLKPLP